MREAANLRLLDTDLVRLGVVGPANGERQRAVRNGKTGVVTVRFEAPGDTPLPDVFLSSASSFEFGAAGPVRREGAAFVAEVPVLHRPKVFDLAKNPISLTVRAGEKTMESPLAID